MKAIIDKLASGTAEYEVPTLEFPQEKINHSCHVGEKVSGEISIKGGGCFIKGVVYSSDERFDIENPQFGGNECTIKYTVHARNCKPLERIDGHIDIISSGGEGKIEFEISILEDCIETSIGEVKNLFTFTNLVQMNYEEAIKVFLSSRFKDVILKDNLKGQALYDALMKNTNKEIALEEFLISVNKKKAVKLSLSETSKTYRNINTSISGEFTIEKSNWGYVDIDVTVEGAFFHSCKEKVSKDDFSGNSYEYKYVISYNMLHSGVNLGRLIFRTHNQELVYEVEITLETEDYMDNSNKSNVRRCEAEITRLYLNFRMGRLKTSKWAEEVIETVDELLDYEPGNQFAKIHKAQAYLSINKFDEAADLLDEISAIVVPDREKEITQYCYFLYVRALFKKSAKYTRDIDKEVKMYFENGHDQWQILWILMYLNERYKQNPSLKYTMIKDHSNKGNNSPILYFDALSVINETPGLLRVLDEFEIKILLFGSKWRFISEKLAKRVAELSLEEKDYNPLLVKALINMYGVTPIDEIAESICSQLISGGHCDKSYNKWFELSVESGAKITKLYEYYMRSLDDHKYKVLPKTIYRYFSYSADTIPEQKNYLYANVIKNKDKIPEVYSDYIDNIKRYALEMIRNVKIDEHLAVIYNHVINEKYIDDEVAIYLPEIINSFIIKTDNKNVEEVYVIHKEKEVQVRRFVKEGKTSVELFTEDPVIILCDANGNRYSGSIEYTINRLTHLEKHLGKCYEINQNNEKLKLHYVEEYIKYRNNPLPDVEIFKDILEIDNLRDEYRREIMGDIIDYYYDNFEGEHLDDYLISLDTDNMYEQTRVKAIEMMLTRGLYEETFPLLNKYGYKKIKTYLLLAFCNHIIENIEFESNEKLLPICEYIFNNDEKSDTLIKYLCMHYYGTIPEMMKIFNMGAKIVSDPEELKIGEGSDIMERILVQMMFESYKGKELYEVYKYYYPSGIQKKLRNAFLTYCAYNYFVRGDEINSDVFMYIEVELNYNQRTPLVLCRLALLKYLSTLNGITNKQIEFAKKQIDSFTERNIVFEFYKKFNKYFVIPYRVLDKTYIEFHTNPSCNVTLGYTITRGDKVTGLLSCDMIQYIPGIFVKAFPVFAKDKIDYYINEVDKNGQVITHESKTVVVENIPSGMQKGKSRYEIINSFDINDKNDLQRKLDDYYDKNRIAERFFKVI